MFKPLMQEQKKYSIYAGLFLYAVGLRAITALAISSARGISLRNLSLFYDGHLYILIARTLPALYSDFHSFFPTFPAPPEYITGWFPVYPFFIKIISLFTGDLLLSALLAAWFSGGIAVVLLYELAKDYIDDPLFAAVIFSFFPTAWLLGGSLALVESTYVCLLLACMLNFQRGKYGWSALFAALTVITQKSGLLILPILAFAARPNRRTLLPIMGAIATAAVLQLYLWWLFGDPMINFRVAKDVFRGGFAFPFEQFIRSMMNPEPVFPGMFWQRKIVVIFEATFYIGVLLWSLIRYASHMRIFTIWLGVVVLFYASLSGIPWSFYAFPRYVSMASPAAIILSMHLFPVNVGRWRWAAAGLLMSMTILWTVLDALSSVDFCIHAWRPEYFRAFLDAFKP